MGNNLRLIFCRGGTKRHTPLVLSCGWLYGLRSDATMYHDNVAFLDIHYQKGRSAWEQHIERALILRPDLTMIPDFEEQYTFEELYCLHDRLSQAGLKTMWTPKHHKITRDIPPESVIGVSVPTEHGSFVPKPKDVIGRKLHLLGGEPDAMRYLIDNVYQESEVNSVDMSSFVRKAFKGQYWSRSGYWVQTHKQFSNEQLIVMSALAIRDYMSYSKVKFNMKRKPILRIWQALNGVKTNQLELVI